MRYVAWLHWHMLEGSKKGSKTFTARHDNSFEMSSIMPIVLVTMSW